MIKADLVVQSYLEREDVLEAVNSLLESARRHLPTVDEEALASAICYCIKHHAGQRRRSGEEYFFHPIAVAKIVAELKLDQASIIGALLHDVIEDCNVDLIEISDKFGNQVAQIVDGITKLTQIEHTTSATLEIKQAENFLKLFVAMSKDLRVVLIKFADRLHNMQTISSLDPEKQMIKARETIEIYAPLAERIGLYKVRNELCDLSFKILEPDAYSSILNRINNLSKDDTVEKISGQLGTVLKKDFDRVDVSGRIKSTYSIWKKLQRRNLSFEQLTDVMAFRVILDGPSIDCYRVLSVIHGKYKYLQGSLKDYISTPKPNGYESVHTTVVGPLNKKIEIQIRTKEMHNAAEYGVAAHWGYKQTVNVNKKDKDFSWIKRLLQVMTDVDGAQEFLENYKLEMYKDQVFAFTPAGEVITMPKGATVLDFAFEIHSEIASCCTGARVNGVMCPIDYKINNGDQIEVVSSPSYNFDKNWEKIVITSKARLGVRRLLKSQREEAFVAFGKEKVIKEFDRWGKIFTDSIEDELIGRFECKSTDEFYKKIYNRLITPKDAYSALFTKSTASSDPIISFTISSDKKRIDSKTSLPIDGLPSQNFAVTLANCCHPVYGDEIIGAQNVARGIFIHERSCAVLKKTFYKPQDLVKNLSWKSCDGDAPSQGLQERTYSASIQVAVRNEIGSVASVVNVVAQCKASLNNFYVTQKTEATFEFVVNMMVKDLAHLTDIVTKIKLLPKILDARRSPT